MLVLLAVVLLLHGFAHLVGFAGSWRLAESIPYKTTLLNGAIDVGDTGIRFAGLLWLAAALGFAVAGVAVLYRASWWPAFTVMVAMISLLMCLIALPDAQAGAVLNGVLILGVLLGMRFGWFDNVVTH
jgi:hypothetical protein